MNRSIRGGLDNNINPPNSSKYLFSRVYKNGQLSEKWKDSRNLALLHRSQLGFPGLKTEFDTLAPLVSQTIILKLQSSISASEGSFSGLIKESLVSI